jgi:hypothetical protein
MYHKSILLLLYNFSLREGFFKNYIYIFKKSTPF